MGTLDRTTLAACTGGSVASQALIHQVLHPNLPFKAENMTDPTPKPPQTIDWSKTVIMPVLVALAAWLGGMQFKSSVTPVPTPTPHPAPVPNPQPAPSPDPTPVGVKVVDAKGNPVTGLVDEGRQFSVIATGTTTLYAVPNSDADVTVINKQQIVVTLRNGTLLQVMVMSSGSDPTLLKVQCNKGPQPPPFNQPAPAPTPKPLPNDEPQPLPPPSPPKQRLMQLSVVEDPLHRTPATVSVLNNLTIWNKYLLKGHQFKTYAAMPDPSDATKIMAATGEPKGIKAVNAVIAKGLSIPALVLSDLVSGEIIAVVPLPTNDTLDSVLTSNGA
jgi:hypothetical protein